MAKFNQIINQALGEIDNAGYKGYFDDIAAIEKFATKNKKNTPDRLELKKFNPILKKMTIHKQIK